MIVVNVEVVKLRDSDKGSATIHVEKRRGEAWTRDKVYDVTPSGPDAKRKIVLEDDQRVVVMGLSGTEVVYDKEQNAAVPVTKSVEQRAAEQAATASGTETVPEGAGRKPAQDLDPNKPTTAATQTQPQPNSSQSGPGQKAGQPTPKPHAGPDKASGQPGASSAISSENSVKKVADHA